MISVTTERYEEMMTAEIRLRIIRDYLRDDDILRADEIWRLIGEPEKKGETDV